MGPRSHPSGSDSPFDSLQAAHCHFYVAGFLVTHGGLQMLSVIDAQNALTFEPVVWCHCDGFDQLVGNQLLSFV
jgi:hypothetical protein